MITIRIITGAIASVFLAATLLAVPNQYESIPVGNFSAMDLSGWEEKSFSGNTKYELLQENEETFLLATSDMTASALYKKIKIDLTKTPYLNWSWRIDKSVVGLNEQDKSGDDYAARVYVIVKLGLAPWKTKALNYVWSGSAADRSSWPNAFTDKAIMIPLRSPRDSNTQWQNEKVNIKEDFKKYFGKNIDRIDGVAIMTDTDNSKLSAVARYGDIFFSKN